MKPTTATPAIRYPESDGKPMAESDLHRDWMVTIIRRLQRYFAGQRVYVSGNLLVYYVEGDPKRCFAPDAFVVKDCDPRRRRIFKIWDEDRVPNFVLETTSRKTRHEDRVTKKNLYAELRIPEYFLYDPLGEWLKPSLQGFRLHNGGYAALEADADGSLVSEELGIAFRLEDGQLAMFEAATGSRLLSDQEAAAAAEERLAHAEERLAREVAARLALEQELRQLRSRKGKKA